MLNRLRIKFVCINMLIVTAMLCVIFGMVLHFTRHNLELESMSMMQDIVNMPFRPGHSVQRPEEIRLPYFILEIGQAGERVAVDGGYYAINNEDFLHEVIDAVMETGDRAGALTEYDLRFQRVVTPVAQRIVFVDTSSEQSTLSHLVRICILVGIISLFAFFPISLFLAHWAVKPVEKAWIQQRQFVADASHELKTPLTVILTNAELLQNPGSDEKSRIQFSESILTMAHQMRGLVESLLELARVDSGAVKASVSHLNFSELVSDAILPFEPLYFERGLEIHSAIEEMINVNGSESHLRQVTEIFLDNAMKYSSSPATVRVEVKRHGPRCLLSVSNPGDPISLEDQKNIFKRFYRVDKARSMNHSYGLGLSIAESIVKKHKGRIWAESKDGLNTFYVELPIIKMQ